MSRKTVQIVLIGTAVVLFIILASGRHDRNNMNIKEYQNKYENVKLDPEVAKIVDEYVAVHYKWPKESYRIKKTEDVLGRVVYLVIYLPDEKSAVVGGGKSFAVSVDLEHHNISREFALE